jgi:PST family polysaccharide transporter
MDLQEKAIKGVIWSTVQNWGFRIISFLIFVLLARLLKPEDFGLMAYSSFFIMFVQLIIDMSLSQAIVQRDRLQSEHLNTAFWISLLGGIIFTIIGVTAAGLISNILNEPRLKSIIQWLSLSFLFGSISIIPQAYLQRNLDFRFLAIRWLFAVTIGGIIGIGMALKGFGVWSLVGQNISQGLFGAVILWTGCKWRPNFNISIKHLKELMDFGKYILGSEIINFFNVRGFDLLIGYFLGPVALGYFNIARRVQSTLGDIFMKTVGQVAFPTFSKLQNDTERLKKAFYFSTQMMSLLAFPVFIGVAILAPDMVISVFGKKWLPSVSIIQILAFIGIIQSVFSFNPALIKAAGRPVWVFFLTTMNAIANLIAFFIAVEWGIVAVTGAYVIRAYILAPIQLIVVKKVVKIDMKLYFRQYFSPSLACAIMVIAIGASKFLMKGYVSATLLLTINIVLGFLIYSITIMIISPPLCRRTFELARMLIPQSLFNRLK